MNTESPTTMLAIDTATETCSVALHHAGKTWQRDADQIRHSQIILTLIDQLLRQQNVDKRSLDLIAVDVGPGSFTGLRIGVAVAKGLGYATNTPVLGVSSLEILAGEFDDGIAFPCLDARMGEVYYGVFQCRKDARPTALNELQVHAPLALQTPPIPENAPVRASGNGWDLHHAALQQSISQSINQSLEICFNRRPQAKTLVKLGLLTSADEWSDGLKLEAAYIRDRVVTIPSATSSAIPSVDN